VRLMKSEMQHKPASTNKQPNQNNTDSITKVYFRLDEPRIVVSFRCNKKLWKAFKKQIRAQGLSICHVLEPMILGWLNAYVNICNTIKPLKIENLVVERAVRRVRRYVKENVDVDDGRVVPFYDVEATVWKNVKVKDDSEINVNGHLVGCGCSLCRKRQA